MSDPTVEELEAPSTIATAVELAFAINAFHETLSPKLNEHDRSRLTRDYASTLLQAITLGSMFAADLEEIEDVEP